MQLSFNNHYVDLISSYLNKPELTPKTFEEISSIQEALLSISDPKGNHLVSNSLKDRISDIQELKDDPLVWGVKEDLQKSFVDLIDTLVRLKINEITNPELLTHHQKYREQLETEATENLKKKEKIDGLRDELKEKFIENNKDSSLEANIKKLVEEEILPNIDIGQVSTFYHQNLIDCLKDNEIVSHLLAKRISVVNAPRLKDPQITIFLESGLFTIEDVEKLSELQFISIVHNSNISNLLENKKILKKEFLQLSDQHLLVLCKKYEHVMKLLESKLFSFEKFAAIHPRWIVLLYHDPVLDLIHEGKIRLVQFPHHAAIDPKSQMGKIYKIYDRIKSEIKTFYPEFTISNDSKKMNWILRRELALNEINDSWRRGLTTIFLATLASVVWTFANFPVASYPNMVRTLLLLTNTQPLIPIIPLLFMVENEIVFIKKYLPKAPILFFTILASIYMVFSLAIAGYSGSRAVVGVLLTQVVAVATFAAFTWRRECQADDQANENASFGEIRYGMYLLKGQQIQHQIARTQSLWNQFIYTSQGDYRFDFFHPSLSRRITKIEDIIASYIKMGKEEFDNC